MTARPAPAPRQKKFFARRIGRAGSLLFGLALFAGHGASGFADSAPQQTEIQKLQTQLSAADAEARRDAVLRLGSLNRADAARAASAALGDKAAIVRATAVRAVRVLPPEQAASLLRPLLQDKDEFVRREAAYGLGETASKSVTRPLGVALLRDKSSGVRAAAAVALGRIKDEASAPYLTAVAAGQRYNTGADRELRSRNKEDNEFVRRSAVRALAEMRARDAAPVLVALLADERNSDDLRREAARALGELGGPAAVESLRAQLAARDPHLARIAHDAIRRLRGDAPASSNQ